MLSKILACLSIAAAVAAAPALAQTPPLHAVRTIAAARMTIDTPRGRAMFPLYLSADWTVPQPGVVRAVIVLHGRLRNADASITARSSRRVRRRAPTRQARC